MKVFYQEENAKIMFRVNEEDMPQIEAYLTAHPSKDYTFSSQGFQSIRFEKIL